MEKKVIIVTGSCGKIGKKIVNRLRGKFRIVGFELLDSINDSPSEELVPVDLSSDESVYQAFMHIKRFYGNKIASVIHLAAYYSFEHKDSKKYRTVTIEGTERLLHALQDFEVEQFIFSSTMLVHAPCKVGEKINENSPIKAKWAYPQSKVAAEEVIHKNRGNIRKVVILRIAGVYDKHCGSIPISHQIARIYEKKLESKLFPGNTGHGSSFVFLDDLTDIFEIVVEKREELEEESLFIVGESQVASYQEMQNLIAQNLWVKDWKTYRIPKWVAIIGSWLKVHLPFVKEPFIKPWMIPFADDHYDLDISKAKKILGWEPKHSLEEMLPEMIKELQENPEKWYKYNKLVEENDE